MKTIRWLAGCAAVSMVLALGISSAFAQMVPKGANTAPLKIVPPLRAEAFAPPAGAQIGLPELIPSLAEDANAPWSRGVFSNDIEDYTMGIEFIPSPNVREAHKWVLYGKTLVPFDQLLTGVGMTRTRDLIWKYCSAAHPAAEVDRCAMGLANRRIFPMLGTALADHAYVIVEVSECEAIGDQKTGPLFGFRCTLFPRDLPMKIGGSPSSVAIRAGNAAADWIYALSDTRVGLDLSKVILVAGIQEGNELVLDVSPDLFAPYLLLKGMYDDRNGDGLPDQL